MEGRDKLGRFVKGCKSERKLNLDKNNKIGVMLHPHHIKSLALYPELVFDINNGITYCEEFHIKSGLHKRLKIMQKEV